MNRYNDPGDEQETTEEVNTDLPTGDAPGAAEVIPAEEPSGAMVD